MLKFACEASQQVPKFFLAVVFLSQHFVAVEWRTSGFLGTSWVYERLLEFDDHNMYMSYRMESNHFVFSKGFQGYVSKVRVGHIIISPSFMSLPCFLKLQEICCPYCFSKTAAIHEPINLTQRKHSQIRQFFAIKCLHVFYPPVAAADSILSIYSQKWDDDIWNCSKHISLLVLYSSICSQKVVAEHSECLTHVSLLSQSFNPLPKITCMVIGMFKTRFTVILYQNQGLDAWNCILKKNLEPSSSKFHKHCQERNKKKKICKP